MASAVVNAFATKEKFNAHTLLEDVNKAARVCPNRFLAGTYPRYEKMSDLSFEH